MTERVREMIIAAGKKGNDKLTAVSNGTYHPKIEVITNGACPVCGAPRSTTEEKAR
jgi:hypothetical protein